MTARGLKLTLRGFGAVRDWDDDFANVLGRRPQLVA